MNMISVTNLSKTYNGITAVNNISFTVEQGKFYAFLGENGAGKSTTINILSTLLKKSSGEIIVNKNKMDKDDKEIRKDIGIVFQQNVLDNFLTVKENLKCKGKLYGLSGKRIAKRIEELSLELDICEILDRRYGKLSGGQKRRVDIARALINHPKILILDEPTTGLDPFSRHKVWECVFRLQKNNGITIFLTTHYMEEAANADRIIVIDKGNIIENDTPDNLKLKYSNDKLILYPKDINTIIAKLDKLSIKSTIFTDKIQVPIANSISALAIINNLKENIIEFEVIKGNLDQVFMTLLNKSKTGEIT